MVLLKYALIPFGSFALDFDLLGIDGRNYTLADFANKSVLVVVFMCNHCPYVQAVWGKLVALQKVYEEKGVQFVGINANDSEDYPEDSFEKMKEYAQGKGQNFPYLRDENQSVAKSYGAECTPDIFVYDKERKLSYHGRAEELSKAFDLLLVGKRVDFAQTPSMGCSIKWK